ncbi:hypothetical protein HPB51_012205 [Rhipicephalus microplus]|uniref:Uncharacterized protein n=1 Tax=Rhipicephalus microplus TaxID=6941 RepID=A0A9J6E9F3_RHIMP|nr:hypothetical protein HPB51_012205 [Rhipicephalus microplus]
MCVSPKRCVPGCLLQKHLGCATVTVLSPHSLILRSIFGLIDISSIFSHVPAYQLACAVVLGAVVWQYITLMRKIYLIDCPGVVYPTGDTDTEIVLKGVVRVENIEDPQDHIPEVLDRVRPEYIVKTYKIDSWDNPEDFLEKLGRRSGKLLKVRTA